MRENRTHGSEGGESGSTGLPYPYPSLPAFGDVSARTKKSCFVQAGSARRSQIRNASNTERVYGQSFPHSDGTAEVSCEEAKPAQAVLKTEAAQNGLRRGSQVRKDRREAACQCPPVRVPWFVSSGSPCPQVRQSVGRKDHPVDRGRSE